MESQSTRLLSFQRREMTNLSRRSKQNPNLVSGAFRLRLRLVAGIYEFRAGLAHLGDSACPITCIQLDGTHSVFGPEPDPRVLAERASTQDIHPTGPMWGRGALRTDADCRALEETTLAFATDIHTGLEQAGLNQERRALRTPARSLAWDWRDERTLELAFELPAGSYATSLLGSVGEISVGEIEDAAGATGFRAPMDGTSGMLHTQADGVD